MDKRIERLNTYFERLVPEEGRADTKAGEVVRALLRLCYRWYNDGDQVGEDYGNETCNPAARYLSDTLPEVGDYVQKFWYACSTVYEDSLLRLVGRALDCVDAKGLDSVPNDDDMDDWLRPEDKEWGRDYWD